MGYAVLPLVLAPLVVMLTVALRHTFTSVSARVWAALLVTCGAIGIGVGVHRMLAAADPDVVETRCEVLQPQLRERADGTLELVATLRWTADAQLPYTTYAPLPIAVGAREQREALEARHAAGTTVPCVYRRSRPGRIHAGPGMPSRARARGIGIGLVVAGIGLLAYAVRAWRRARGGQPARGNRLADVVRLVGFCALAGGVWLGDTLGTVLAILGGLVVVARFVQDFLRSERTFKRLRASLEDPRPWPKPPATDDGWDPYEDDRVTGTYRGRRVWAALTATGAIVQAELVGWSQDLAIERSSAGIPRTGDDAFDRAVQIKGDATAWRPVLAAEARALLRGLFERRDVRVANGKIEVVIPDGELGELMAVLAEVVAIPPADAGPVEPRVFAQAAAEPLAAVRLGHYQWLIARGWEAPRVYRTAAADRDPAIAAWAREHVPPAAGAFR
ncbi:MAG: hypothetical protein SFX73_25730 [Kofleriaceae bacterium]|nr:hypothetical protein [Kofleriaceae bacterium]